MTQQGNGAESEAGYGGIPASQIQYLIDRLAVRDVLGRYARGIDRHDVELLKTVFWPDAQINYTNSFTGPRDEFIEWGNELHARQYELHQHHITNQAVDFDGDVAHVESYVIYLLRGFDGRQNFGAGRYIDVLERRDGEWRIILREFLPEMRFNVPSTYDISNVPQFARGTWDTNDISYVRPLQRRPDSESKAVLPEDKRPARA